MADKHWYIVQAYSNFERKVADSIREQAKQRDLDHLFDEMMVPTEKVVEVRRGQKIDAERKFFPGYVLVKMDLTDEAYHLIKNTPKVTGFLGATTSPSRSRKQRRSASSTRCRRGSSGQSLRSHSKSASKCACQKAHSPPSTGSWRKWMTAGPASKSRYRFSVDPQGSSLKWDR